MREILGNVSTMIAFNISHVDATMFNQEFALDMGGKVEYIPPEEFITLKVGEAWEKIGKSVFPLKTALAPQQPDFTRTKEVIDRSRQNYGLKARTNGVTKRESPQKSVAAEEEFPFDTEQVF
jgi:hypothetical protein